MKAEFIDRMGTDLSVVNSARVSFSKESNWVDKDGEVWIGYDGTNGLLSEKDQKLIKYLAEHDHWTPFSHVMITMRETVPIFVARQRFKHMVGFTYNEESRRYVDDEPKFFEPDVWRKRAENKKQGSLEEEIDMNYDARLWYHHYIKIAERMYNDLLNIKVAPEQARMVLPQSMYTSYYVTGSLAAWARAYKLRSDPHAQKEIQDLAAQWNEIISNIPELRYSWNALVS